MGAMKLVSPFAIGLVLILATRLAPLCAAALPLPSASAQEILIDQWSDTDYRLSCERPANAILIPAAQADIEGRAGLVTLSSNAFVGSVRGVEAPEGAHRILMDYLSQELDNIDAGEGFEFRGLPVRGVQRRSCGGPER
ncbi:MAG: hypothetical protein ACI87O_001138 [Planctomycetota bacterium]|jgi:hypothetical protein